MSGEDYENQRKKFVESLSVDMEKEVVQRYSYKSLLLMVDSEISVQCDREGNDTMILECRLGIWKEKHFLYRMAGC